MEIISFDPAYADDFKRLNLAWLNKYFWVEPHDEEVLGDPQRYILDPGGSIFLVKERSNIGTVALMKMEDKVFDTTPKWPSLRSTREKESGND